jgi:hypothetical protein
MGVTGLKPLTFNYEAAKKELLESMRKINRLAGRAWLDSVIKGSPIPTFSGASRATFQKLARDLGTSVPIGPTRGFNNGVAYGRSRDQGSGVIENKQNGFIGFIYKTSLRHLIYNEYNSAVIGPYPKPWSTNVRFTPYFFQVRGAVAWEKVASKYKFPNPYKHLRG